MKKKNFQRDIFVKYEEKLSISRVKKILFRVRKNPPAADWIENIIPLKVNGRSLIIYYEFLIGNHNKQYKLCHVNYAQLHEYNCSV